jgi:hypothetical protein
MTHYRFLLLLAILSSAECLQGQGLHVTIGGGLYVDSDGGSGSTEVGPTIQLGVGVPLSTRLDLNFDVGLSRKDFRVGVDELHRNAWAVLVGLEAPLVTGQTSLALELAGGISGEDDVSETDPTFTSSTRWSGVLSPGLKIERRAGDRVELFLGIRDHITGMFNAAFDRSESAVRHRIVTVVGVRLR